MKETWTRKVEAIHRDPNGNYSVTTHTITNVEEINGERMTIEEANQFLGWDSPIKKGGK